MDFAKEQFKKAEREVFQRHLWLAKLTTLLFRGRRPDCLNQVMMFKTNHGICFVGVLAGTDITVFLSLHNSKEMLGQLARKKFGLNPKEMLKTNMGLINDPSDNFLKLELRELT